MNLLIENVNLKEGTFYEKLLEEGIFDFALFLEIIEYIDEINQKESSKSERLKTSNELWPFGYRILFSISCHFNSNDVFKINNPDNDKLVECLIF